jgi:glycerol uptake facilitator-like aquaporin
MIINMGKVIVNIICTLIGAILGSGTTFYICNKKQTAKLSGKNNVVNQAGGNINVR